MRIALLSLPVAALLLGTATDAMAQKASISGTMGLLNGVSGQYQGRTEFRAGSVESQARVDRAVNEATGEGAVAMQNFGVSVGGGSQTTINGALINRVEVQEARNTASGRNSVAVQNFGVNIQ